MRIWLRSIFNAVLGKIPGKTGCTDTATRMVMDAPGPWQERDDGHLVKSLGALADVGLLEELIRIVNEAQQRDA
jgi:hypothetical protein